MYYIEFNPTSYGSNREIIDMIRGQIGDELQIVESSITMEFVKGPEALWVGLKGILIGKPL